MRILNSEDTFATLFLKFVKMWNFYYKDEGSHEAKVKSRIQKI